MDDSIKLDPSSFPLSQTRRLGNLIFVSGQLPIDKTLTLRRGDIREQTMLALENMRQALAEEGADFSDVVKVNAWLSDASLSAGFNEIYREVFKPPFPARTTVVAQLVVPADVELEAIAVAR